MDRHQRPVLQCRNQGIDFAKIGRQQPDVAAHRDDERQYDRPELAHPIPALEEQVDDTG